MFSISKELSYNNICLSVLVSFAFVDVSYFSIKVIYYKIVIKLNCYFRFKNGTTCGWWKLGEILKPKSIIMHMLNFFFILREGADAVSFRTQTKIKIYLFNFKDPSF